MRRRSPALAVLIVVVLSACTAMDQPEANTRAATAVAVATARPSPACRTTSPAPPDEGGTSRSVESTEVPEVEVWVEPAVDQVGDDLDVDIEGLVRDAVVTAARRLPPRDEAVNVAVAQQPSRVIIPQLGVGAWTTHSIAVAVDVDSEQLEDGLAHLPALLAHETHHVWRHASDSGAPQGLAAAAVAEGLADHFARQVYPDMAPPPWTSALPDDDLASWWHQLLDADGADVTMDDHDRWFFGTGSIPVWAGYTLGFELVDDYLACQHTLPSDHVTTPWERIIAEAGQPWSNAEAANDQRSGSGSSEG